MIQRFPLLVLLTFVLAGVARATPHFKYRVLEIPAGYTTSGAEVINDQGWVLGWANGPGLSQAQVLWKPPAYAPEIVFAAQGYHYRWLNNQGAIALTYDRRMPFLRTPVGIWANVTPPGEVDIQTEALNNAGDLLLRKNDDHLVHTNYVRKANGAFVSLLPNQTDFTACGMNDYRIVVGRLSTTYGSPRGVMVDGNTGAFLSQLPMTNAHVINNSNFVGGITNTMIVLYHGAYGATQFALPDGNTTQYTTEVVGIDGAANLVADYRGNGVFCERATGKAYWLDDLVYVRPGSVLHFSNPGTMNTAGQIAVVSYHLDPVTGWITQDRACILTPAD